MHYLGIHQIQNLHHKNLHLFCIFILFPPIFRVRIKVVLNISFRLIHINFRRIRVLKAASICFQYLHHRQLHPHYLRCLHYFFVILYIIYSCNLVIDNIMVILFSTILIVITIVSTFPSSFLLSVILSSFSLSCMF